MKTSKDYLDKKFNFELDEEELQILEDIKNDKYVSLTKTNPKEFKKEIKIAQISAKNSIERLSKKKTYTMKFIENDIEKIKGMALERGLPYQTFISSIIHQIATKQIKV